MSCSCDRMHYSKIIKRNVYLQCLWALTISGNVLGCDAKVTRDGQMGRLVGQHRSSRGLSLIVNTSPMFRLQFYPAQPNTSPSKLICDGIRMEYLQRQETPYPYCPAAPIQRLDISSLRHPSHTGRLFKFKLGQVREVSFISFYQRKYKFIFMLVGNIVSYYTVFCCEGPFSQDPA